MSPEFSTSDLYFAAYLRVAGAAFKGIDRQGTRVFFVFDEPDQLGDLKNQYFNRQSRVCALSYANEIKAFKSLIHNGSART